MLPKWQARDKKMPAPPPESAGICLSDCPKRLPPSLPLPSRESKMKFGKVPTSKQESTSLMHDGVHNARRFLSITSRKYSRRKFQNLKIAYGIREDTRS